MNPIQIGKLYVYPFASRKDLIDYIVDKKKILIAINAEKILKRDPELIRIINSNIGYADGVGAVWALRKKGASWAIKIPGVELWLDIVKAFYQQKTFYLIGASDEVINLAVEKLKTEYNGIQILGYHSGYFNDAKKQEIMNDIVAKGPDIVFVAMGSPKQEYFMNELSLVHPALYMGLGGSFDVYTGKVKRAPKFFIALGIEWLYRLLKQPQRITRQIRLVKFLLMLIFRKL